MARQKREAEEDHAPVHGSEFPRTAGLRWVEGYGLKWKKKYLASKMGAGGDPRLRVSCREESVWGEGMSHLASYT